MIIDDNVPNLRHHVYLLMFIVHRRAWWPKGRRFVFDILVMTFLSSTMMRLFKEDMGVPGLFPAYRKPSGMAKHWGLA